MARRTIDSDSFDRMSIDDETGKIYWDNREVVTTLSLPWWGQWALLITAAATSVMALVMLVQFIISLL